MLMVESGAELAEALRTAPEGTLLGLTAAHYRITEPLVLDRRLTLQGCDPAGPAVLRFADGRSGFSITAAGSRLANLVLTASGHRGTPLLHIAADGCRLSDVALVRAQGSGLRLEGCRDTVLCRLVAQELGQEAVVALDCDGLRLSLRGCEIGRRHAASAIRLVECRGFAIVAAIAGVSGSAVSIEATGARPRPVAGRLKLRAERAQRALSVLGHRNAPVSGLVARVTARDWGEMGALLSNADDITLTLAMPAPGATPALHMNGRLGLRRSRVILAAPDAEPGAPPPGLVTGGEAASHGTSIEAARRPCPPAAGTRPALPEAWRRRLPPETEPRFETYELPGRCSLCGWEGRFRRTHRSERETLACGACRAPLRYRGQAEAICAHLAGGRFATLADLAASGALAALAIYEPGIAGPLRRWLRQAGRYEQSVHEPGLPSGTRRADGLVCQDLMATSFPDASFDLVVTSDIFEHIRRPFVAFAEIRRILKPGGLHVWTVPLGLPPPAETRARVDTSGPEDRLLLPPVHHGSGSDGLSLVYTDFGRDIVRLLGEMGMPTQAVRHIAGTDGHVAGVTLVSTRVD